MRGDSRLLQAAVKRAVDVVGAAVGLLLLAPLFALVAVAIRAASPGSVLFRQQRVGRDGRLFMLLKFRSMRPGADKMLAGVRNRDGGGTLFKLQDDPRITRVGRLLRRWSLDELPQLWNVLKGDMSLVGPRPALPEQVGRYTVAQAGRLAVRPGLTGLWQVSGRSELSFEVYIALDLFYATRWSIGYDLELLARTVPAVLTGRGAY